METQILQNKTKAYDKASWESHVYVFITHNLNYRPYKQATASLPMQNHITLTWIKAYMSADILHHYFKLLWLLA